jgi:rod shape-determining protein MreD
MLKKPIYLSLLLALILQMMSWPSWAHPEFVLLVLLYWLLRAPEACNIGTAWAVGLLIDLADGGLFGQHALAFTLTAFLALFYQRRLILFTSLQQSGYVFLLLVFNQLMMILLQAYNGQPDHVAFLFSSLISVAIWHLVHVYWLNRER